MLVAALLMTPWTAGLESPIEEMAQPRPELLAHVPPAYTPES